MTLLSQVRRVGRLVWVERRPYLLGVVFVAFSTMTALLYPYVVQLILDDAIGAGQSRLGNYGPLSTPHHRLKTHSPWRVKQPFPGIYLWRDPHGAHYLVDHTGTRVVPRAA